MIDALLATILIWLTSSIISIGLAIIITIVRLRPTRISQHIATIVISVSRGIPTSAFVLFAGFAALQVNSAIVSILPSFFPGTHPNFQFVAWSIVFALAFGSSGHIAAILISGVNSIPAPIKQQMDIMGINQYSRLEITIIEMGEYISGPLSARLTHHLHNTTFAAIFPVTDAFGHLYSNANRTYDISEFFIYASVVYIAFSLLISFIFNQFETWLSKRR